jgi:hypothetical protein
MKPAISLSQAMNDVNLLSGPFQAESFWTWKTVAELSPKVGDGGDQAAA